MLINDESYMFSQVDESKPTCPTQQTHTQAGSGRESLHVRVSRNSERMALTKRDRTAFRVLNKERPNFLKAIAEPSDSEESKELPITEPKPTKRLYNFTKPSKVFRNYLKKRPANEKYEQAIHHLIRDRQLSVERESWMAKPAKLHTPDD